MRALIVDIETTSPDRHAAGIVEIGATWYQQNESPRRFFEVQCRPYYEAPIDPGALAVNGCDWLYSPDHPSEAEALEAFADFLGGADDIMMMGWNAAIFDWLVLERAWKQHLPSRHWPFSFRTLDLHSMAAAELHRRGVWMPHGGIKSRICCEAFGLKPEPKPHRALGGVTFELALAQILLDP